MSEFRIDKITNRDGSAGTHFAGITTFSGASGVTIPGGLSEYRGGRGRAVFACGALNPGYSTTMDMIEISTTGNATDFGDASFVGHPCDGGVSSSTRGVWTGAYLHPSSPKHSSAIDYVIISSGGGSHDFGDTVEAVSRYGATSDGTRGVIGAGQWGDDPIRTNVLQYITIASVGKAEDFGDMTLAAENLGACSSPTRGVYNMGYGSYTSPSDAADWRNVLDYITIATKGNAIDFGEKGWKGYSTSGCSNNTRGVFAGGYAPSPNPGRTNIIEYITFASLGDTTNFGDLTAAMMELSGTSNSIRGVFGCGATATPSTVRVNTINYITVSTTGDAADFGDLTEGRSGGCAVGDNFGGISQ